MRKYVLALLVIALIILNVMPAYCEQTPAFIKFRRGVCNITTFHLEFMHQVEKEAKANGQGRALTVGFFKGLCMSAVRALTGVYEIVTFPIPIPAGYKPILTDPEFYWTDPFSESNDKVKK